MALARRGKNSDVYVIATVGGYQCFHDMVDAFFCSHAYTMISHLQAHRAMGDKVPLSTFQRLNVISLEECSPKENKNEK